MAGRTELPDDVILDAFRILNGEEGAGYAQDHAVVVAASMSALWLAVCDHYELKER